MFQNLDTEVAVIEETFKSLTNRNDIGIILINQHVGIAFSSFFFFVILYH